MYTIGTLIRKRISRPSVELTKLVCPACKLKLSAGELTEAQDLKALIAGEFAHSDCYYQQLGKPVDERLVFEPVQ